MPDYLYSNKMSELLKKLYSTELRLSISLTKFLDFLFIFEEAVKGYFFAR